MIKSDIKLIRSLQQKKVRNESRLFVVEGRKMIAELIQSDFKINKIFTSDLSILHDFPTLELVKEKELEEASGLVSSPGVLALVHQKEWPNLNVQKTTGMVLLLDGISDPGNMGTIIRTAEWFGVKQIVCSENCVEVYNPKVVQATMGSVFRIPLSYEPLREVIEKLHSKKITTLGAFANGKSMTEIRSEFPMALVIGSESSGISDELKDVLQLKVAIPGVGEVESLNASVATGILLSKFCLQS